MKQSVKRALDTLEALGFKSEPHPHKAATTVHWHANEPETPLKVFAGMSDAAASKVIKHAEAILGLASTETESAEKKAQREGAAKKREAAEREKGFESAERLAEKKEADARETRRRQYLARQNRGTLTTDDRLAILAALPGEWISPDRIADELCIPEQLINDAIAAEELVAYMHPGKRKFSRIADVQDWIAAHVKDTAQPTTSPEPSRPPDTPGEGGQS